MTKKLLDKLASYGFCCVLLICLFCLTLFGTLYQVDYGLYEAKKVYFSSFWLMSDKSFILPFPGFPGGLTVMGLLSINMLMGGLVRLKIRRRNLGVVLIHIGIAFMLGAGLVKTLTAKEGNLKLIEGQTSRFFKSYHNWEVAIWPMGMNGKVQEHVIRHEQIADLTGTKSRTFTSDSLPFDVKLTNFVQHCRVEQKGPMWQSTGPAVDGYGILELTPEKEAEFNVAGMHVQVGDQKAILWGIENEPWTLDMPGHEHWAITLRHESYEMPFEIQLTDFMKEEHPGLTMARSFRSQVVKIDENGEENILIQMNEPLRQDDLVLFQSSYGTSRSGREYSVFSVVHNVSDKWPEYALWVITLGMLYTFIFKLAGFIGKTNRKRAATESAA
ncbi:MAG: hypothetical protein ACI841_005305 [Planctomycetota bacterium]|jgi:hypothetical protein